MDGQRTHNTAQPDYFKGRGAQLNPHNTFLKNAYVQDHAEGLDEPLLTNAQTEFVAERPKKIVNRVDSPDIPMPYSMNPYQGCEHGCVYCYARNTHQYWGLSAGLDFERKIIIKENAAELLAKALQNPRWNPAPIMLSGNTDCYQPAERKLQITRRMLQVLSKFRNPVGIITKNSLILRDLDILRELAAHDLVKVSISITTLNEELRRKMEPRTATGRQRLKTVERLSAAGIPVNVMVAPIIPGLNSSEIVEIIRASAEHGATSAAYTMVRLNGPIGPIFEDWIRKAYPDRAVKVLHQIASLHGGKLGDSRFGARMRGEGNIAKAIRDLFKVTCQKYFGDRKSPPFNLEAFERPPKHGQLSLFRPAK